MPLSLDVVSVACFAFATGMVFVLHFVERPAYALLRSLSESTRDSIEPDSHLVSTKRILGQFLTAGVPQVKAALLVAGTAASALRMYTSGDFISLRGLLVLFGVVFIPVMAGTALPAARRVKTVPPSATTKELGAALGPLLKLNRIGSLATLAFFLLALLVSWLEP